MKPSFTVDNRWGKGPKHRLRFRKFGDPDVEEAYATHLVRAENRTLPVDETAIKPSSRPAMGAVGADR